MTHKNIFKKANTDKLYYQTQRCFAKCLGDGTEHFKMQSTINQRYPPFTVAVKPNPSSETPSTPAASCFASYLLANNTALLGQGPQDSTKHKLQHAFHTMHFTLLYILTISHKQERRCSQISFRKMHDCKNKLVFIQQLNRS